eukprot:CAMPEP_0197529526 /NCGR_PEP_ID=MMETSP1318-20131121/28646_1 /TAXON_ID=552666 /ORGANISM="Partenskyella glossopodia, Strain RCC365" /LENGTH=125 /DNA_ID=CAMNT_0043085017 /DNA_START=42 /DNA_END=415 /DNA_ORIENTATION=+
MTENTRWLARHRVRHVTGKRRSLGLLVRLNWVSRKAKFHAELLRAAGEWPPPASATYSELDGNELFRKLRAVASYAEKEDFMYDENTWDIDGLKLELRNNGVSLIDGEDNGPPATTTVARGEEKT